MTFLSPIGGAAGGGGLPTTVATITAIASPLTLLSADVNNPKDVLSTIRFGTVKLPAANTSGFTPGPINFPIVTNRGSEFIRVKNAGTEGTDPMLEAVIVPNGQVNFQLRANTAGSIYGQSYTAPAGVWNKQNLMSSVAFQNQLCPMMPVPLLPGSQPQRLDLGTTSFGTNTTGNSLTCLLSSTLGLTVFMDSSNNVRAVPFQCSADGITNQVIGANTQVQANGGAALRRCYVIKLDATRAFVGWYDSTNTKNVWVIVTLTPGALPSAPTLAVGTALDDTALATAAQRIQEMGLFGSLPVLDFGGGAVWCVGLQTTSAGVIRPRAYYLTLNLGAGTMTFAQAQYDTSSSLAALNNAGGYVIPFAANKVIAPISGSAGTDVAILQFNGGAINNIGRIYGAVPPTMTWAINQINTSGGFNPYNLIGGSLIDAANGIFLFFGTFGNGNNNSAGDSGISIIDTAGLAVKNTIYFGSINNDAEVASAQYGAYGSVLIDMGNGEFIATNYGGMGESNPPASSITRTSYIDYASYSNQFATYSVASSPFSAKLLFRSFAGDFPSLADKNIGWGFDKATRRVCTTYMDTQVSTGNDGIRTVWAEMPRR